MIGVHDAVLGMLPMKNYNHYTIAEIFADHPDLKTSLLGEPVLLAPIEFKALASLQNIIDSGSIGQFKLALSKGSSRGIRELAKARGGDIGGIVLSAFKLASAAVSAFKIGDYKVAKELMDDLQRQYGIGAGSFTSAEETMFVATLSSPSQFSKNEKDGKLRTKGNPRQVLLALDTTFSTDANDNATPAQRAKAARIVAQESAWRYDKRKAERKNNLKNAGTNGFRTFSFEHSSGGGGGRGSGGKKKVHIVSTDWLAIFWAIANAEKVVESTQLKPMSIEDIADVYTEVFTDKSAIKGFEAAEQTVDLKTKDGNVGKYLEKNEDKDGNKYPKGDPQKKFKKRKGGWNEENLMEAYPPEDHPGLYTTKGGSADFAGNEPMYRFLVYSDLQNPQDTSILGNFMPKGTLNIVLRTVNNPDGKKNFLPFEADLFYESFYSGDELDKLLPTVSQGGEEEDDINLQDLSMSNRARRRRAGLSNQQTAVVEEVAGQLNKASQMHKGQANKLRSILPNPPNCGCGQTPCVTYGAKNPPSDGIRSDGLVVPIFAGEPKDISRNLGVIFSEVQIGRNVVKDVGEVVQSIYRGLIGGRTSMAEKRLAMGIASMQKELSDRALEMGANAIGNLKIDYEPVQGSATITIIAHADAIVVPGISIVRQALKKNPQGSYPTLDRDKLLEMIDRSWVPTDGASVFLPPEGSFEIGLDVPQNLEDVGELATKIANETGKTVYVTKITGPGKDYTTGYYKSAYRITTANPEKAFEEGQIRGGPIPSSHTFEPSRQARKRSSSKKPSSGNMISIELTPRTQVKLSTAVDKADWYKAAMKDDKTGKLKALWNEYAKGDNPGLITERGIVKGWKWRGKDYMFSKEELKGGKSTNKQRRKKFPAALEKAIAKDGTYADYKKGQTNMRMIYAKRIDNDRLVPFRINIPKILLRKRADKVVPKAGGKKAHVQLLLDLIEENFGKITLDTQFISSGGYDTYKETSRGRKLDVPVDRGIHLLYKTQGLDTEGAYSTNAFPAYTRGGKIVYRAMTFDGKPVDMEVES